VPNTPAQDRARGQIIAKGDRRWLVRVYTGQRKYSSKLVRGTYKQAEQKRTQMLRELDTGTFVAPTKQTLAAFLQHWLDTTVRVRVTAKTLRGYSDDVKNHITPRLGTLQLDQIQPQAVQAFYAELEKKALSPRTIRSVHQVLRQALGQAVAWNMAYRNAADYVSLPKAQRTEMQALTPTQVDLFLETAITDSLYALWHVLLNTGARPQEALALRWSDFDGSRLTINRALSEVGPGRYEIGETKTKRSRRTVSLPATTAAVLTAHRSQQAAEILAAGERYERRGLIFANSVGNTLDISAVRRRWKACLKQAGLPMVRLYDTRHTHASCLLAGGVNPKVVSERLGHSTIVLTLDTYSHVLPELDADAANTFEKLVSQSRSRRTG
jgi:integrase